MTGIKASATVKITTKKPLQALGDISYTDKMCDRKAVIKNADMSEEMQQDAVDCATQALEKFNIEKDIAAFIKKEFDKKYNPTWHCIVGRNFGSYVTHETRHFIYFYLGQVAILLFKSG
ncbi:dynein light chain 2, cytoplasmic isoform X1 [Vanessa atalanta]|uniref:dynein light chain 2, cytoplasmic isoform X1 n=1 Tax=Vanessa atalanta TaxID=42275 RepID=UPI001FCE201E|nr:dynein light chain 2, cytoplasmic isoform X1 [Vanessa atalanta]